MIDQIKAATIIAALMSGLDPQTIEEKTTIKISAYDDEDATNLMMVGKLLHMAHAAHAASMMEQFRIQGFSREEAIPLIASILRK